MDRFQKEDVARRAYVNMSVEKTLTEGSYELKCGKCKKFVCFSDDLRVLQVPYTLHPKPFTLHPSLKPYTINCTLYTLNDIPYTLQPTLYTVNPTP